MRDMMEHRERVGGRNLAVAVVAGVIAMAAIRVFGIPGLDPSLWGDIAEISGIRPPHSTFPGLWRILTGWMFTLFGVPAALKTLSALGTAAIGVATFLFCLIVRQILALLIRTGRPYPVWSDWIAPGFSLLASILFGVSAPVERIFQIFSSEGLRFLMLLAIVHVSLRWFTVGGRWRLFPLMALMGVLTAETPFGFILPMLFVGFYVSVWNCVMDGLFPKPECLPMPGELPKWRMFLLFLGGLGLAVWMNTTAFVAMGGAKAQGWDVAGVYFRYATGYLNMVIGASTLIGWVLGTGFCVLPFVVALRLLPLVVRDDRQMPFGLGALLFFVGFLALAQSGAIPAVRFWTFASDLTAVYSGFLLSVFVFCAMATVGAVGAAFAFECQRTYLSTDSADEETEVFAQPPGVLLRRTVPAIGVLVLALAAFSVPKAVETEMQGIVDAAVEETVEECGDAEWLFTDGHLDPAIEIAAARRGRTIRTLNLMSGGSAWECAVRQRGFTPGTDDYKLVETGVPALLRMWAGERTNGMEKAAIQLGFEFWKREQKPMPRASGVVARERGMDEAAAAEGIRRTKALIDRILAISDKVEDANPSSALSSAFSAVNWRISRFAYLRNDVETADGLDRANSILRKMLSAVEYERQRTFMQLTPREGLEIALRRANYAEAKQYSIPVLNNDPDDPQANFAMGMAAIMKNRYKEAEIHLARILKRRPKEPAALNNLSIVCRKQGKYKEAEDYARRALEVLPGSPEVQRTLSDALKKAP